MSFVFGGKLFVVFLGLLLTPIITRLFTPVDYGEFALFNLVVQNMVVIGTLSLPMAISTVNKKELSPVFSFTVVVIVLFAALFMIGLLSFDDALDLYFGTSIFNSYWYYILIGYLVTSSVAALAALNIREKRFKFNTGVSMTEATSSKIINLIGGFLGLKSLGLILSDTLSKSISLAILIIRYPKKIKFFIPNLKMIGNLFVKLREFPLYLTPSQWLGTISSQVIIWFVAYKFSSGDLGQLTMAVGLLGIPLNVLSNSFQPVITERLVNLRDGGGGYVFFKHMFLILFIISFIGFTIIYLIPNSFVLLFLGGKWIEVNSIMNIYCGYFAILFLEQSFSNAFVIFKKQKEKLILNIIDVCVLIGAAIVLNLYNPLFLQVIIVFVTLKLIISIGRVILLWKIIKKG